MKRLTHKEAADVVRFAWQQLTGRLPNRSERQLCQAMGLLETGYGSMLGGNNWGANLALPGEPFISATDSKPVNGKDVKYTGKFRAYTSHAEGCAGMLRVILGYGTADAARTGDVVGFARALYTPKKGRQIGYYSGIASDTPDERVMRRAVNLLTLCIGIAKECKEDVLMFPGDFATVNANTNPTVNALTALGGHTVKSYQALRGLTPDGIVGPATWATLTLKPAV
jgi:hypothetical protein